MKMSFEQAKQSIEQYRAGSIKEYGETLESIKSQSNKWFFETTGWGIDEFLREELRLHLNK